MRKYTKPAVTEFPLNLIRLRLQGTGEPLTGTNCVECDIFALPSFCSLSLDLDDYFFSLLLENTTCAAAAFDVSSCSITVGANVFTNCTIPGGLGDISCQGGQDCRLQILCDDTGQTCQLADDGAAVQINCPGFEVCSTNLQVLL